MNILITGAYGFVGTNLINNLKIKHNLYGLDIVCPTREGVLKTFCWKDIDPESFPLQTLSPNLMQSFILPERLMIRKTNQLLSLILILIPV